MKVVIRDGFDNSWVHELKSKINIVSTISKYTKLDRKGKQYWACCPFHLEKTPSFAINEIEQFFKCFGCGVSGDVISFVQKIESIDFFDACKMLAKECNMELPEFEHSNEIAKQKQKKAQSKRFYFMRLLCFI